MSSRLILALCAFHFFNDQIHANREVTFTQIHGKFLARTLYQRSIDDEVLCLNICYDQRQCKFVHYSEDNCTIYGSGNIPYYSCEITYKLDRTLTSSFCTFEIPIRRNVEFKPIEVLHDQDVVCSGLPSEVTTIHMYLTEKLLAIYSISDLIGNYTEVQRLFFAKTPQSHCTSIPVFTGASNSRLYFGDVYNTSGYYFLNAYAFTGKCACIVNACCGNIVISEYLSGTDTTSTNHKTIYSYIYSNSDHPTFFFSLHNKQSEQQYYIAGEEWLAFL
ncbi:unnamed protein product [Cylicocyclus nassatus]|uniref:Apple domain-containing protein n=1 Tax=Cylicocyclus nassatus TaxID=53992 RepID=A0AA36HAV0_CYLNA|nr:unnamed protein product [Cylicocyclus nassatus]